MLRRFARFIAILLFVLTAAFVYVGFRLAAGPAGWALLSIPFVYSIVTSIFLRQRLAKSVGPGARFALVLNGLAMGWVSFIFVTTLARDLILLPAAELGLIDGASAFGPEANLATVAVSFLALAWGVFGGLRGPRLRDVAVAIADLPPALDGFSIAHITDLHIGPTIRKSYVESVVRLVNSARVDMVALTGDIIDGQSSTLAAEAAPLAGLQPAGRVYYVPGNHEYYWDSQAWFRIFREGGFRLLLNEGETVEKNGARVWIGGVVDPAASARMFDPDAPLNAPDIGAATGTAAKDAALRILLAHQPDVGGAQASAAGYDLQLSGHTHGGQFFPWTLAVRRAQQYHLGLFRVGRLQIYVGPGTGSWGPPVRLGTRTEVARITLKRA